MRNRIHGILLLLCLGGAAAPVAARPNPAPAAGDLVRTAHEQLQRGEAGSAIRSLTLACQTSPEDAAVHALLAEAYLSQGTEPMALVHLEKAVALDSLDASLRLKLAALYAKGRRWQDAGRQYQAVLRGDPADSTAAPALGRLYLRAKQWDPAVRVIRPYFERHPGDESIAADYFLALENLARWPELAAAADRVLESRPDWVPALRTAARAHLRCGRFDAALARFLHWNDLEPLGAADAVATGSCYAARHDDAQAVQWFERGMRTGTGADFDWAEPGAAFMRLQRWEQAAQCYERKAAQDSSSSSALLNYALCEQQLGKHAASRTALLRFLAKKPDSVPARYGLANTYVLLDSTGAARREYTAVLRLCTGRGDEYRAERVQALRYLGVAYLMDREWAPAVQALDGVLGYTPGDVEMRLYRAQALLALDRKAEARAEFESVLRQQPQNAPAKKGLELLAQYN